MNRCLVLIVLLSSLMPCHAFARPDCGLYRYRAVVTDVYDGDTLTADIDLGFNTWRRGERLRLYGVDTPEVRGPERGRGIAARDALRQLVLGETVTLCTLEDRRGKYGRTLARVFLDGGTVSHVNAWLILRGFGVPYRP